MFSSGHLPPQSNSNKTNYIASQQMTPTSMTFMNNFKEQPQAFGNSQSNQFYLGQSNNTPSHNNGGGFSNINEPNSTSVTPFLKPTARQHDLQGAN